MRKMQQTRRKLLVLAATLLPVVAYASEMRATNVRADDASQSTALTRSQTRTTWDSVYTAQQAGRGESTYARTCSRCHQESMGGADESPALTGGAFTGSWNGQTLHDLHDRIRNTMPTDTPGTYSRQDVSDVLAYMLKFNQFPAGASELPTGEEELKSITWITTRP